MKSPWNSISQRIKWAYYILVALVVVGLIVSWINLTKVRARVYALETASQLLDTVLEIRRYEKNWLLYGKSTDFKANREMIDKAFQVITGQNVDFFEIDPLFTIARFKEVLTSYSDLMAREYNIVAAGQQHRLLDKIRKEGKTMVSLAEILSETVRQAIAKTLKFVRISGVIFAGILAFLAIVLGKQLSSSIVKPLESIVDCTKNIAAGKVYSCRDIAKTIDIVEISAVVEALHVMLEKLEHREKLIIKNEKLAAVGTLVAGVAHELNNPLSNAGSSAQILLEEMQEAEEVPRDFQLEMIEQIVDQTDRARSIVRSLLEFSREKEVNPERMKISELLHQTMDLVRGEVPTQVAMHITIPEDGTFRGDKQRLQQALVNLLLNAFHAIGEKGLIELRGRLSPERDFVFLEVIDNGPGIPPDIIDKIFDPFFTTKDVGEGSGLGLSVTREIIDKHAGTISVKSIPGTGTLFTIKLPVEVGESMEPPNG